MENIRPLQSLAAVTLLATLFDYGAVTYGAQKQPLLLAKYGSLRTSNALIESVYGVSAAEFEAGWQRYLASYAHPAPPDARPSPTLP
jgi:hypothetical protein